jgi:hypothetical protein
VTTQKWICLFLLFFETSLPAADFFIGPGAYFLEPREQAGAAGRALPVNVRPMIVTRADVRASRLSQFFFEPQLGLLFPQRTFEGATSVSGFVNADLGWRFAQPFVALAGFGAQPSFLFSNGSEVNVKGRFVTPGGQSLNWVFTSNLGVGYRFDSKLRLESEMFFVRPLSATARKLRFGLSVVYAI